MLRVLRPARALPHLVPRRATPFARVAPFRLFSITSSRFSEPAPAIFGPGAPAGTVPSDEEQATGLERLQLLGEMEGIDVFDMGPLEITRMGTLSDPIKVISLDTERLVGCTGFPVDSHDTIWLRVNDQREHHRCPECGCVFKLDFVGEHGHGHH